MPEIPGSIWRRADMFAALQARDIGNVFRLIRQYAGLSQTSIGSVTGLSQGKVSAIMSGSQQVIAFEVFERVADGLNMPDAARMALGLAPRTALVWAISSQDDRHIATSIPGTPARSVEVVQRGEDETNVRRREFVGLAGVALFNAALGPAEQASAGGIEDLAAALVDLPTPGDSLPELATLARAVSEAKQRYQACRYGDVVNMLPSLLRSLQVATATLDGDARSKAHGLAAEAYHVAASILLKQEDKGLAWLAAGRSVQTAHASGSPLMIGSSSRIITRALLHGGHREAAVSTASAAAQRMDAALLAPTSDDLSIYGSLLLQGAIAAAQQANRHTAVELLDEAGEAGRRLGRDGNHMWTAFGPNNVLCHRVNVALTMGDAGTAVEYARKVDIEALPSNERKATLLLDTARAFLVWGKHDRALSVMRAAGNIAPEEIAFRPVSHRLVRDLVDTAPISIRREAREFAQSLGVAA
ncbi:helix-turn-helix domain-containing protein [Nonomuraea sp. CA-143628]|uniref:helix-turn-helix domain-containing protein n=1 Tax=Nonomuraea sp. CA-143628 TaxID=3239997 RepID=UPI003D8F3A98